MHFRKPWYRHGYAFLRGSIRVLRDDFSVFLVVLPGKKGSRWNPSGSWPRTQSDSASSVSTIISFPWILWWTHMGSSVHINQPGRFFFLLSLQSKYYSVARVERHHQEQEVRKASRAAVSLQPWSSRFKPWSSVHVQLCLLLPFSECLMIFRQNMKQLRVWHYSTCLISFYRLCSWGFQGFHFCHFPYSPCIHRFIYYKIIIHMELLSFVLFFGIGFSV